MTAGGGSQVEEGRDPSRKERVKRMETRYTAAQTTICILKIGSLIEEQNSCPLLVRTSNGPLCPIIAMLKSYMLACSPFLVLHQRVVMMFHAM